MNKSPRYRPFDYVPPKAVYTATVDPTVNDDKSAGYTEGSKWYNTVGGECFLCVDDAVGAAIWLNTSFDAGDVAAIAISGELSDATDLGAISTGQVLQKTAGGWEGLTLAAVATSGDYSDLIGKPALADVATSGLYSDLIGGPSASSIVALIEPQDIDFTGVLTAEDLRVDSLQITLIGSNPISIINTASKAKFVVDAGNTIANSGYEFWSDGSNVFEIRTDGIDLQGNTIEEVSDISYTGTMTIDATTGVDLAYNGTVELSVENGLVEVQNDLSVGGAISYSKSIALSKSGTNISGSASTTHTVSISSGLDYWSPMTVYIEACGVDSNAAGLVGAWWCFKVMHYSASTTITATLIDSGGDTGSFTTPSFSHVSGTTSREISIETIVTNKDRIITECRISNFLGVNSLN